MLKYDETVKYLSIWVSESRIAYLDKHVQEQDSEILRLLKRVDAIVKITKDQKAQISAILESGSSNFSDRSIDEKPPHY